MVRKTKFYILLLFQVIILISFDQTTAYGYQPKVNIMCYMEKKINDNMS